MPCWRRLPGESAAKPIWIFKPRNWLHRGSGWRTVILVADVRLNRRLDSRLNPMSATIASNTWISLRVGDPAVAGVTIHSQDGDLFALTKQMIARAGRIAAGIEAFDNQLTALRAELEGWAAQRADLIDQVFLALKGDQFLFLVVLKGKAYNGIFEDDLTELDMSIAQNPDYDLIPLSVLALPACAEDVIRSFLPDHVKVSES